MILEQVSVQPSNKNEKKTKKLVLVLVVVYLTCIALSKYLTITKLLNKSKMLLQIKQIINNYMYVYISLLDLADKDSIY